MKRIHLFIISILLVMLLVACQGQPEPSEPTEPITPTPEIDLSLVNPQNDIYYLVFVRSFADSDNDGIGDLNGITDNLSYLVDLGVTALWLMPINPSPSYHGYNVMDYLGINEDYGTMDDFQNLIDEAADVGIKIVIDLVINHTSDQHPWYVSARSSTSSPYRDYYIWNNGSAYETFVGGMKDLNLSNPVVVQEIKDIMDFYLDMGVHGFRIDAAGHLFEGINAHFENMLLLLELNAYMKENHPDSFMVSEVFDYNYQTIVDYFIGSDSLFNFYAANQIWDKVGSGNTRYLLTSNLEKAYDDFKEINPDFVDSPFIGNHDLDRIASRGAFAGVDGMEKLSLSARVLLTLPGSPFIYYGDELGMKGYRYEGANIPGYGIVYDEYRRQPFLWGDPVIQTTWLPSDGSNDLTLSAAQQIESEDSLYHVYREMALLRQANPALMYGNTFLPYVDNTSNIQGFVRHYVYEDIEQAVLVIHNLSSLTQTIDLPYLDILYGTLEIPAFGSLILEIDPADIEAYT